MNNLLTHTMSFSNLSVGMNTPAAGSNRVFIVIWDQGRSCRPFAIQGNPVEHPPIESKNKQYFKYYLKKTIIGPVSQGNTGSA